LLDGYDRFPVFVDAEGKVLSVPPIVNSHETGKVTEETTEVFVECTGHDYDVVSKGLNMIVCCLADMGGKIFSMTVMDGGKKVSPDLSPSEMKLDLGYVNKRLGLSLKDGEVKSLLEKMGYGYSGGKVLVPAYRTDVLHQVDLIEDIAIAYGYENFEEEIPHVATIGSEDEFGKFVEKIGTLLIGMGLLEVKTYHLTTPEVQRSKMDADIKLIELENPSTQEYTVCRGWVVPSLMEVLEGNKHHEYPQKIFDTGSVFQKGGKEDSGVAEFVRVGVVIAEDHMDYTKIRQVLDYILGSIGAEYSIEEVDHKSFLKGRVGRVIVGGVKVGYVGEIKPKVLDNFGLEVPVGAFEVNLSELFNVYEKLSGNEK
jgi:phenylalanyl-tRNA synthetase beta chain